MPVAVSLIILPNLSMKRLSTTCDDAARKAEDEDYRQHVLLGAASFFTAKPDASIGPRKAKLVP